MATSLSSEASSAAAPGENGAPAIRITGITKHFGDVEAVRGVDLDIIDGEFFSMLGPSGSGKTTMLRMIAGFELPTTGRIELAGRDVTKAPPFERDVNTVFQDYALFPHMTVEDNVAYGLRVKRVGKKERTQRAHEALERVQLAGYEARRPGQLSGGQRQRVALARALVNRPKVLLLDEPLGALDLKLRQQMQIELKAIQRDIGITFVFVTHDQEEALTMSDRVAVFNAGRIEQVDTAVRLYEKPETEFVAAFVGSSNLVEGDLAKRLFDSDGAVAIRPERLHLSDRAKTPGPDEGCVDGVVSNVVFLGPTLRVSVATSGGGELEASVPNTDGSADPRAMVGREVRLIWRKDQIRAVETG